MMVSADPSTALGMMVSADPSTALGMTPPVIPSERTESRDLHRPVRGIFPSTHSETDQLAHDPTHQLRTQNSELRTQNSPEEPGRKVRQIVPPIHPRVSAAALIVHVLHAVLVEQRSRRRDAPVEEVFLAH